MGVCLSPQLFNHERLVSAGTDVAGSVSLIGSTGKSRREDGLGRFALANTL